MKRQDDDFGDPENREEKKSYPKMTDLMICLDQPYQENISNCLN